MLLILSGVVLNTVAVALGGLIGNVLKHFFTENIKKLMLQSLSLGVLYVGISGLSLSHNTVFIIVSLTIGAILGEIINFDGYLDSFGLFLQKKFEKQSKFPISEGFIAGTLFICPGSMAIVGSLQSGLEGNHDVLIAKALIDLVFVIIMSSNLGLGTSFAAFSVFIYEAFLTLSAHFISGFLSDIIIDDITCIGSILMVALALNMLKITKIKISNLILTPFIPILLHLIF